MTDGNSMMKNLDRLLRSDGISNDVREIKRNINIMIVRCNVIPMTGCSCIIRCQRVVCISFVRIVQYNYELYTVLYITCVHTTYVCLIMSVFIVLCCGNSQIGFDFDSRVCLYHRTKLHKYRSRVCVPLSFVIHCVLFCCRRRSIVFVDSCGTVTT